MLASSFRSRGFGNGDTYLIEIVEQFANGRDPMSLVIGETLMGLDMLKSDPSSLPSGIPVLLQVRIWSLLCIVELCTRI